MRIVTESTDTGMTRPLLDPDEPPAVTLQNEAGGSPFVLTCDHAANRVPRRLAQLGLAPSDLERHIALDIGAAAVAHGISRRLDAPLVTSAYSRLVIDLNRPPHSASAMLEASDGTPVPGNRDLGTAERQARIDALFMPYHRCIDALLDVRSATGAAAFLVAIHSFTPAMDGHARPWHVGVSNGRHRGFAELLLAELRRPGDVTVGDNEPYTIQRDTDYGIPVHGDDRDLPSVMIEIRQDLIMDAAGIEAWGGRLARCLQAIDPARPIPQQREFLP